MDGSKENNTLSAALQDFFLHKAQKQCEGKQIATAPDRGVNLGEREAKWRYQIT